MRRVTRFTGTVTTSGNSGAIRLEKSLFRAHPEFELGHTVSATVIAPAQLLVSVADTSAAESDDDPILASFLSFLAADIQNNPGHLRPLSDGSIARAVKLTEGILVGDDEVFPDDLTL